MSGLPADPDEVRASIEDKENEDALVRELETILPGKDPLGNLYAMHQGALDFVVLSARDGGPTYYHVELLEEPTCTCDDMRYNRDDPQVCKHIVAALLAPRMSVEETMSQVALEQLTRLNQSVKDARDAATALTDARINQLSNAPESEPEVPSGGRGGSQSKPTVDPEDAREELQSAFDDATKGMKTMVSGGKIWVNKSPDAPDWTFDAFLKEPDKVFYEPDDAPREYYTNSILPDNVEEYIDEVLS